MSRLRVSIIVFLVFNASLFSQSTDTKLQKNNPKSQILGGSVELLSERTQFTKKFKNSDGSFTTAASNIPLHFYDYNKSEWSSIDYTFKQNGDNFTFPNPVPKFEYSIENGTIHILESEKEFSLGKGLLLKVIDKQGNIKHSIQGDLKDMIVEANTLTKKNVFSFIDVAYNFDHHYFKYNYYLKQKPILDSDITEVILEEIISLKSGNSIRYDSKHLDANVSSFSILNENGNIVSQFQPPVISDASNHLKEVTGRPGFLENSKERNGGVLSIFYELEPLNENQYIIRLRIPAAWILDAQRVYPVVVDPLVVVQSSDIVNTCFFPQYQASSMSANVPAGDTIVNTYIEWDFVATNGSDAWTEDQRSYVAGPNGTTTVFVGTGQTHGMQTYSIQSNIGNTISQGQVSFTFFASRVWGGGGCNATYNFINRRYIEITHFESITFGPGNIMINEYSCSNRNILDQFGNYEDWIELYNDSPNFANLQGYYLSDNPNQPYKWQIPGGVIPPYGHIVVICSGRGAMAGNTPHSNFKLSQLKPESILLSSPDGTLMESYTLWTTQNGHSYGRTQSGGTTWGVFENPTPGNENVNSKQGYTTKPQILLQAGSYPSAQMVEIFTNNSQETIRYTLDGSEPNSSSPIYNGPVNISTTSVLRARCFSSDTDIIPGFVETHTYFINDNFTVPVFSVSGEFLPTLFNGSQIQTLGSVEFFSASGQPLDKAVCEFRKHGNDSWSYPQRGVRITSRDEFGYKAEFEYPFFNTTNRVNFQRLILKAAANDNYPHESSGAYVRDAYIQHLSQISNLELDERSTISCLLFVNGQYWGVYEAREKIDDNDFTNFNYNQDELYKGSEDHIQYIKTWGTTDAEYGGQNAVNSWIEDRDFILNNNMGIESNYQWVKSKFNLQSLVDYFVINSFVVSRDWLNYNTGWWRGTNPAGSALQWRYILWDMDASFGHYTNFTGVPDPNATAAPCNVDNLNVGIGHTQILRKLMQDNEEFRQLYVTRYADLLNTHFKCENLIQVLDSMINVIEPEMPRQIQRWGGNINTWQNNVQILKNFINQRCVVIKEKLKDCYNITGPYDVTFKVEPEGAGQIKMNSEWLNSNNFEAFVYGNIKTLLDANPNQGYVFSHWTVDTHTLDSDSAQKSNSLSINQSATITAHFTNPLADERELIHYWHFNSFNSSTDVKSLNANFTAIPTSSPVMTYTGEGPRDIDPFNEGSELNLHLNQVAGRAARVRNPSQGRDLVFSLSTQGYKDILFVYSVQRSGQGMLKNIITYTSDGINYTSDSLLTHQFDIFEQYNLVVVNFSHIQSVVNNPEFKIKISFEGNTTNSNGNNRFDNISLKGVPFNTTSLNVYKSQSQPIVYPNPTNDFLNIKHNENIKEVKIHNVLGALVFHQILENHSQTTLNTSSLPPGIYTLTIHTSTQSSKHKFIKQ